jgi:hypothetical protein
MVITRRKLAGILAASVPVAVAAPQAASDDDNKSAHDQMQNNAQQLAKVAVPMATEPAFHFKA